MANENDQTTLFKLDLDAESFTEHALSAKETFQSIFETESLAAAGEKLIEFGVVAGGLAAVFYTVKGAMDLVFDAENIKATIAQFETLTRNAGIYGETLKEALEKASGGLLTEDEQLKLANKALVELQVGASRLGEVMTIARQATAVFGGELQGNFERITQAIASGNARGLRSVGIIIDQKKAYDDYAKSIGVSAGELSKAGQQQAMMNAVLSKGKESFAGVNADVKEATNTWTQIKVITKEFFEGFVLGFDSLFGPTVKRMLSVTKQMAVDFRNLSLAVFGNEMQKASIHAKALEHQITDTQHQIVMFQDVIAKDSRPKAVEGAKREVIGLTARLEKLNAELEKTRAKSGEGTGERAPASGGDEKRSQAALVNDEKIKESRVKLQREMEALDAKLTDEEIKEMESVAEADILYAKKRSDAAKKIDEEIVQLAKQAGLKEGADAATQAEFIKNLENNKLTEVGKRNQQAFLAIQKASQLKKKMLEVDEDELLKYRIQALDMYLHKSENVAQGIGRAFQVSAQKNKMAMQDFGAFGSKTMDSFSSHSVNSLQAFGAGTKSATDAVASMFGGMVGDMATQYGTMMLLASIWPPNPVGIAGGAALIALGGFLGSLGGGSASASTAGISQTANQNQIGAQAANNPSSSAPVGSGDSAASAAPQKHVTMIVQGHMMMNDQTQKWLVDQIRSASDATGFTVQSANGGF